jgi:hypothetical protein
MKILNAFFNKVFKKISCKIGYHNWHVIKSIKISNLIIIIKKRKPILKNVNLKYEQDYIVTNRECKDCPAKDFELDHTKKVLEEKMFELIKIKNKNNGNR